MTSLQQRYRVRRSAPNVIVVDTEPSDFLDGTSYLDESRSDIRGVAVAGDRRHVFSFHSFGEISLSGLFTAFRPATPW